MLGARINIAPVHQQSRTIVMDAALLGHCPGQVQLSAINRQNRQLMRQAGFGLEMDLLEGLPVPEELHNELEQERERLQSLHHVPVPVHSVAEFLGIFPNADKASDYASHLAGKHAWLALAVKDFFDSGGQRLWVVSIPQNEHQQGFLPQIRNGLHESWSLRGLACLFPIENLGLVAMPDLERLQIKPNLNGIRAKRLANPNPAFVPCLANLDDDHKERGTPQNHRQPLALSHLLDPILAALEYYRPDLQCLFSPSLAYSSNAGQPVISQTDLTAIENSKQQHYAQLRRVQLVFPYLKNRHNQLKSACGHLLGLQCQQATQKGSWRSIAGQRIDSHSLPFPSLNTEQRITLRDRPGISLLHHNGQFLSLDDERLSVPALHPDDYTGRSEIQRSAEIRRFMGQLMRELKHLGQSLIFNIDPSDTTPRLALENYFNRLYQLGALRGASSRDAFRIQRQPAADNAIQYDIEIAPAYPIDTIKLVMTRANDNWGITLNG